VPDPASRCPTGAGKTTLPTSWPLRCAAGTPDYAPRWDDFKHRWRHASQHGYDRVSGEGYHRNAYDFTSARDLLLHPAGGSGRYRCAGHDSLTGQDHRDTTIETPVNAILIVDSVFAFRPEYNADFKKPRIMTQRQR
jgi:uridine kinase